MKSAERLSWLAVTDMTSRVFFATHGAMFVLQFICGGGGRFVILLCHSESLSLYDCGCTQATGQKNVI